MPDFARALELARASAEFRETGSAGARRYRARFWSSDAAEAPRSLPDRRPSDATEVLIDDRPVPYARELWLPLVWFLIPQVDQWPSTDIERDLTAPRGRAEAARGRIQHVLRRPAAEAAVGDTRRASRRSSSSYDRATSRTPAIDSASTRCSRGIATFIDLWDRGLRAREEGASGSVLQRPTRRNRKKQTRGPDRARRVVSRSRARDRQAARALRVARRSAARSRRGRACRSTSSPSS